MKDARNSTRGRPFGGSGILVKNRLRGHVNEVNTCDPRLTGVVLNSTAGDFQFVNVYFSCNTHENDDLISEYFGKLQSLIVNHNGATIVMGDFNLSTTMKKFAELTNLCDELDLEIADINQLAADTITFSRKGSAATSWIDHCVITGTVSCRVTQPYTVTPSDHLPLCARVKMSFKTKMSNQMQVNSMEGSSGKINWKKITDLQKKLYCDKVLEVLEQHEWRLCTKVGCDDSTHCDEIKVCVNNFINILVNASSDLLGKKPGKMCKTVTINGWNDIVKPSYDNYVKAFKEWQDNQQLNVLYQTLWEKRKLFKYALRKCRRTQSSRLKDDLAMSHAYQDFNKFWSCVKKAESTHEKISEEVDGVTGEASISDHWATIFVRLFNTKQSTEHECLVNDYIQSSASSFSFDQHNITEAIMKLKSGKCSGSEKLQAEHNKLSNDIISPYITLMFNAMLAHGYIPSVVMMVIIVPIVKKKGLDARESSSYRPIAIDSVISKILEIIILHYCRKYLGTKDNQFGYKVGAGTEMAIYSVKQVAHYYVRHDTPVYACYMDASKAFDLVNHFTLLKNYAIGASLQFLYEFLCTGSEHSNFVSGGEQAYLESLPLERQLDKVEL